VGTGHVLTEADVMASYGIDWTGRFKGTPAAVIRPADCAEVAAVVSHCKDAGFAIVPQGGNTGLVGGGVPLEGEIVLSLRRLSWVADEDFQGGQITAGAGTTIGVIQSAAGASGWDYGVDLGSRGSATIGGTIATNAGGLQVLRHGSTRAQLLGVEAVLGTGVTISHLGGLIKDNTGYDLGGLLCGSEGTLGVVTEIVLRIVRVPESTETVLAAFSTMGDAGEAVSRIIAEGITPAAIEMMDRLAIQACEEIVHAGYPDCGAALIVELDGPSVESGEFLRQVIDICSASGATETRVAASEAERALIWKARKAAFASMGRISPSYYVQDGVIPRTRLRDVLESISALSARYGLRVANVFHAGDGNLHPLVLYDNAEPGAGERALELAGLILESCITAGGSITGEHGVGSDKACYMPKMFSPGSIAVMGRVRDAFDPGDLCNPGKALPTPRLCGEVPGMYRPHAIETAGLAERL